ncbi:MAG: hypothetical protein IKF52_03220 [Clostridia bacterium]|nr:hypothetical protein [Clostridia bacterium]
MAYLNGTRMCLAYADDKKHKNVIEYYEKVLSSKYFEFSLGKFYRFLGYKKMGKRGVKEVMLFHFPVVSYFVYRFA